MGILRALDAGDTSMGLIVAEASHHMCVSATLDFIHSRAEAMATSPPTPAARSLSGHTTAGRADPRRPQARTHTHPCTPMHRSKDAIKMIPKTSTRIYWGALEL